MFGTKSTKSWNMTAAAARTCKVAHVQCRRFIFPRAIFYPLKRPLFHIFKSFLCLINFAAIFPMYPGTTKATSKKNQVQRCFRFPIRVYASQNGQKKGRSLKITKHILSRFLFHKKLIWTSYFSSRGLIQTQNHFFFEKNWPENRPPKKYASQNGQIWISIIFWWRYFFNFYHHRSLENLLKNGVIT